MKPVSTLTPFTLKTLVAGAGIQSLKKVFEAKTSRNSIFFAWINRFYGMILLIGNSMSQLIKRFFVSAKENGGFQLVPAIVVFLLALSFQGAIVYIMISSLLQR
jgi:phosphate starvation-inducible membrane PsiE